MKSLAYSMLYLITASLIITSCATFSGFEEGRALGKGTSELMFSGNMLLYPRGLKVRSWYSGYDVVDYPLPYLEMSYKYGMSDKLDLGIRLNTNLNVGGFLKYQLIGDNMSKFALGICPEFTYFGGYDDFRVPNYCIQFPVNMSYYISNAVSINLSPRYIYQFIEEDLYTSIHYFGGNVCLLFGEKPKVRQPKIGINIGYNYVEKTNHRFTFGIGAAYRFSQKKSL